MRIAVAGSTGLIGGAVAATLAGHGHELVRIGRAPGSDLLLDLAGKGSLDPRALAGCDALVHAAGVTDEDFADRPSALAKAERGAQALLDAARHGAVPRLVYFSSAHVYGPLEGLIDESHAVEPRSDYARAHLATESLFHRAAAQSGAALLIARPCAVYGMPPSLERFARWALIPFDLPRQAIEGRIVLKSHGGQRRNFVSADGLASLVGGWLGQDRPGATVANAPGRDELSVFDFATLCARICMAQTGRDCAIERPAGQDRLPPPFEYRTRVGGHLPGPSLEDHVRELIRALLKKKDRP
jgi:UDP-glucose 4-epimerase